MFSWFAAPRPLVALAPMAGVTDASYRQFIKTLAPETIVYTELLSTNALSYRGKKTLSMLSFDPALERPFIVQIFGKEAKHFLEAAKVVEQAGADGIDINMGCPAAKVVSSCHGAALIRNPDLAAELVHAAVNAVSIPVSVKTRLGWSDASSLIPFCQKLEQAGAAAFAIHGRTYTQKFSGNADWEPIYELKRKVNVPVIGNGDILTAADAVARIGNLDGVMVGRGTMGNPWVMREVCEALRVESGKWIEESEQSRTSLRGYGSGMSKSFAEKIPFILEHCRLAVKLKGEERGMREMRRHFCSYVKGVPGAAELRARLVRVERMEEAEKLLTGWET